MTRRRYRTDGLSSHVANRITSDEASELIARLSGAEQLRDGILLALERPQDERDLYALTQIVNFLRRPELWSLLHDDPDQVAGAVTAQGICRHCGRQLPVRASGARGRRREFCNPACKQMDYRNRNQDPDVRRNLIRSFAFEIAAPAWRKSNSASKASTKSADGEQPALEFFPAGAGKVSLTLFTAYLKDRWPQVPGITPDGEED